MHDVLLARQHRVKTRTDYEAGLAAYLGRTRLVIDVYAELEYVEIKDWKTSHHSLVLAGERY